MRNCNGLCLGGPRDGQWYAGEGPQMVTLEQWQQSIALWHDYRPPPVAVTVQTVRYTWYSYMPPDARSPDDEMGFWVFQGLRPQNIFRLLVEGYRSGVTRS